MMVTLLFHAGSSGMRYLSAVALSLVLVAVARAEELTVAVAANFAPTMRLIEPAFERATGHELRVVYGSSGGLYAQILNGAPYDLFLSADQLTPGALIAHELAVGESRFTYAVGGLVLWSPDAERTPGVERLQAGDFSHLAIANPELAPYGQAAMEVISALGPGTLIEARLVMGESISQAYQFVASGAAELGLVALSQVRAAGQPESSYWQVPRDLHAPILQDAILLSRAAERVAGAEFLAYLRSAESVGIMRKHGYLMMVGE